MFLFFCVNVFYLYVLVKRFEMQLLKALYKIKFIIIINTFSKKQFSFLDELYLLILLIE